LNFGFEARASKFYFKKGKICSSSRVPTAKILTNFKTKFAVRSPNSETQTCSYIAQWKKPYPPGEKKFNFFFYHRCAMHPDHQYIEALRQNDPRGIRKIYDLYSTQAIRWVTNNNGTSDDAQDVFQEALIVLYEKACDQEFVLTCPLGALLHVVWSRKWIDRIRSKNKESEVRKSEERRYDLEVGDDVLVLAEDALSNAREQESLAKAFEQLSELCRRMLSLLSEGADAKSVVLQLELNSVDTLYRRKNACTQRWRTLFLES